MTSASRPTLLTFTISHYCEKTRWALDSIGFDYREEVLVPGPHMLRTRRLGLRRTTVPILLHDDRITQGSSRILDAVAPNALLPSDSGERDAVLDWERRLDRDAGVTLRRILYDSLLLKPAVVIDLWSRGAPRWAGPLLRAAFPLMARNLRRYYRIRPDKVEEATEAFDALADDLDRAWADGSWLVGNAFSRADLTAAALLAPLCMPQGHPVRWPALEELPEATRDLHARYADRVFFKRTHELYDELRDR